MDIISADKSILPELAQKSAVIAKKSCEWNSQSVSVSVCMFAPQFYILLAYKPDLRRQMYFTFRDVLFIFA